MGYLANKIGEGVPEAPFDGKIYGRRNFEWEEIPNDSLWTPDGTGFIKPRASKKVKAEHIDGIVTDVDWNEIGGDQSDIDLSGFNNDAGFISDVSGLVPYTGATDDVDLGEHSLIADSIKTTSLFGLSTIDPEDFQNEFNETAAIYSLQKLTEDDTAVIKVRRSSDNAEQDFTSEQIVNGSLENWVGSGNGFVTVWYDQRFPTSLGDRTGNRDAIQTNIAKQPYIILNGVLTRTANGSPALFFTTEERGFEIPDNGIFRNVLSMQGVSFSQPDRISSRNCILFATTPAGGAVTRLSHDYRDNEFEIAGRRLDSDSFVRRSGGEPVVGVPYVTSFALVHEQNRAIVRVNGENVVDTTFLGTGSTSDTDSERVTIGLGSSTTSNFRGYLSELIIVTNTFDTGATFESLHENLFSRYLKTDVDVFAPVNFKENTVFEQNIRVDGRATINDLNVLNDVDLNDNDLTNVRDLQVNDDLEVGNSIVLTAPNNTKYRVQVDNDGNLTTTAL